MSRESPQERDLREELRAEAIALQEASESHDLSAWNTFWSHVLAENLNALDDSMFATLESLPGLEATYSMGEHALDARRQGDVIVVRCLAPTALYWFVLVLDGSGRAWIPGEFWLENGSLRCQPFLGDGSDAISLDRKGAATVIAFAGAVDFLAEVVYADGLVEVLQRKSSHVVMTRAGVSE